MYAWCLVGEGANGRGSHPSFSGAADIGNSMEESIHLDLASHVYMHLLELSSLGCS